VAIRAVQESAGGSGSSEEEVASNATLFRLYGADDLAQFWGALKELLRAEAPYDALIVYVNFLDFATSWRAAKILMTPNARRPVSWFEGRRRVDMTPQFVLMNPPGLKLYRLSDVVPNPTQLMRTPFFRNYLAPGGWQHLVCQLYWRADTVCSQIAIRRTREQGDFTRQEIARLEALHPHIEKVLNRMLTLEDERARRRWLECFNNRLPIGLMYLSWELEAVFVNHQAFEYCAAWNYGTHDARRYHARSVFRMPALFVEACAKLKAQWRDGQAAGSAAIADLPQLTVSHPLEPELTATVSMQLDAGCPTANPGFLVHVQNRVVSSGRDSLTTHSMLASLTPAERELARFVCQGFGNRDIAGKLGKSLKTVKGQLTSVYRKLDIRNRSHLIVQFGSLVH
jgi:DNA-binding CsgD family transcriptional regulator